MKERFPRNRMEELGIMELTSEEMTDIRKRGLWAILISLILRLASTLILLPCLLGWLPSSLLIFPMLTSLNSFLTSHFASGWFKTEYLISQRVPENTQLCQALGKLSNTLGIRPPELSFSERVSPIAFSYGVRICITRGLIETLDDRELVAVLSHELGHIKHRDPIILGTINLVERLLCITALFMFSSGQFIPGLSFLVIVLGALPVILWMNRRREYAADKTSEYLVDGPISLSTALTKLVPCKRRDLLLLNRLPLYELPRTERIKELFSMYPALTRRISTLLTTFGDD